MANKLKITIVSLANHTKIHSEWKKDNPSKFATKMVSF